MPKKWLTFTFLLCTIAGAFFVSEPAQASDLLRMDIHTIPAPTQEQLTAKGRLYYFCLLEIPVAKTVADHGTGKTVREIAGVGYVQKPLTNNRGCDQDIPFKKTSAVAWMTPDGQYMMRTIERDARDLPVYDGDKPRWVYWRVRPHKPAPTQELAIDPDDASVEETSSPEVPCPVGFVLREFAGSGTKTCVDPAEQRREELRGEIGQAYHTICGISAEKQWIDELIGKVGTDMEVITTYIHGLTHCRVHQLALLEAKTPKVQPAPTPDPEPTPPPSKEIKKRKKSPKLNLSGLTGEQVTTAMRRSPVAYPKGWHPVLTGMVIEEPHVCDIVVLRPKRQSALDRMGYIVDFGCNGQPMRRLKINGPPYGPFCGRDSVVHLDTELGELVFPLSKNPCEKGIKGATVNGLGVNPY